MTDHDDDAAIRRRLETSFAGRATVRIAEAAAMLNMTEKTLRRHIGEGSIAFRSVGTGHVRMRREFALSDLVGFYAGRRMVGVAAPAAAGRPVARAGTGLSGFLSGVGGAKPRDRLRTARGSA